MTEKFCTPEYCRKRKGVPGAGLKKRDHDSRIELRRDGEVTKEKKVGQLIGGGLSGERGTNEGKECQK